MKFEFSAGGVVYKKERGEFYILVSQHSGHHGWVFPKGLIGYHPSTSSPRRQGSEGQAGQGKKETKEETALREVQEETGVHAEIVKPLALLTFWYKWEDELRKKTVYYFVMKYISGDIRKHDWEMEKVEWLQINEVHDRLTYPGDKKVWKEAKEIIANG